MSERNILIVGDPIEGFYVRLLDERGRLRELIGPFDSAEAVREYTRLLQTPAPADNLCP